MTEPRGRCGWTACRCTHEMPCEHGWIDLPDRPDSQHRAAPCPNCKPELYQHLQRRDQDLTTLRRQVPNITRAGRK